MATSTINNVHFAGVATCVPKRILCNLTDCRPQIRAERERLVRNIGIQTRRISQNPKQVRDVQRRSVRV